MPRERIIAGLDIGSDKIVSIIAQYSEEEGLAVIGVSSVESRGIKKGVVVDIDKAVEAISEALSASERMAGVTVAGVYVTVGGVQISSVNSPGVVAVSSPDTGINNGDVQRVIEAAQAISIPSSREIIHVIPRSYNVDSQEGVLDPVGMSGVRLQVETHIVSGATTALRNLAKCVQQVGLDVESLVFNGLAAADAVLTETEKELGVVLLDIGGGTTSLVVFEEGSPAYSAVLPLGGKNITNDIAIGLRISLEEAEKIKHFLSRQEDTAAPPTPPASERKTTDKEKEKKEKKKPADFSKNSKKKTAAADQLDLSTLNLQGIQEIDRAEVFQRIIKPRLEEIFDLARQELKRGGYEKLPPSGLVICGGAAQTIGITKVAQKSLRVPVRIGYPQGVSGLIEEISTPAFAAAVGMLIFAAERLPTHTPLPFLNKLPRFQDYWQKAWQWARGFLP